ncbi:hypothetical protein AB664_37235 [Brucella anthropi]|uniref:Uncharacterized protein n=1 Tax=Brucella anthropi TaxID=529 RepID=A0A656Z4P7_BRUAN|nr:hypothetical protein AB664_37235 [Brucella anthropi]
MPLFSITSQVYSPEEVEELRHCFSHAAIMLAEKGRDYDEARLAETIIRLHRSGLRDRDQLAELACRMIEKKPGSEFRGDGDIAANRNTMT